MMYAMVVEKSTNIVYGVGYSALNAPSASSAAIRDAKMNSPYVDSGETNKFVVVTVSKRLYDEVLRLGGDVDLNEYGITSNLGA